MILMRVISLLCASSFLFFLCFSLLWRSVPASIMAESSQLLPDLHAKISMQASGYTGPYIHCRKLMMPMYKVMTERLLSDMSLFTVSETI
jgi:hypothetical protein